MLVDKITKKLFGTQDEREVKKMRKIKIIGAIIALMMSLSSCTAVALGAGAVAGGYTCLNTNLCNKLKK